MGNPVRDGALDCRGSGVRMRDWSKSTLGVGVEGRWGGPWATMGHGLGLAPWVAMGPAALGLDPWATIGLYFDWGDG